MAIIMKAGNNHQSASASANINGVIKEYHVIQLMATIININRINISNGINDNQ